MGAARTEPQPEAGGQGGLLTSPGHLRSDLALIERALRDNYPIEPEHRAALVAEAIHIATAKNDAGKYLYKARERLRALAVVDRFDRTNLERVRMLAGLVEKGEPGYQPSELHKHEHLHVEPPVEPIQVVLVDDWYGSPDVEPDG